MAQRIFRLSATAGLLALGLLLIPAFAADEGVAAPETDPSGGPLGPVMSLLVAVNGSLVWRVVIFLGLCAAAGLAMFWRRMAQRGWALLIIIDGVAVLWIALQLWGIFSAVVGQGAP